jgi:uncharacterized membrane protein
MTLLILGLLLWAAPHLFKRLAPAARASMGDRGRAMVGGLVALSVLLMILGYRAAEITHVYAPINGMAHLNNTLMLVSVFFFGIGGTKGLLYTRIRHPMLWGMVIWAGAHLLVNGDMASIVLFGGLGLWAVSEIYLINRAGAWVRPKAGRGLKGDAMNLAGTAILYALITWVHYLLGHNPFAVVLA